MGTPKAATARENTPAAGGAMEMNFRPVEDSHPLDWARITQYLDQKNLSIDLLTQPRQFAGGLANLNYLLKIDGDWAVLRRPPSGPLPPGANDMVREHHILSNLWRELPLAPRSLHLCDDPAIAGAPFQLIEFRQGVAVRGDSLAPLPETRATGAALSNMLIDTLARIHAVDVDAVGLQDLGSPQDFFRRTCRGWLRRADRILGDGQHASITAIAQWLDDVADPPATPPSLLHNDFKLDNVLLDPADLRPVAILDWDMGTRGDPLFDLATLLSYWTEPGDPSCMQRLAQMPSGRPGFLSREAAANSYAERAGRPLDGFKAYRVLSVFKLGVVFHQLHQRHVSGETKDPRYSGFRDLADELLGFCMDIARDKIF